MRVIAGSVKGRMLVAPKARSVRPTAQHVKESVFNILAERVCEAVVYRSVCGDRKSGDRIAEPRGQRMRLCRQ